MARSWPLLALLAFATPAEAGRRPASPGQPAACEKSGQRAGPVVAIPERDTTPRPFDESGRRDEKVVGRVRSRTPLVLEEVRPRRPGENPWWSDERLATPLAADVLPEAELLRFGDIVEVTFRHDRARHGQLCGNGPHMKPAPGPVTYVHAIAPRDRSQPALLIRWQGDNSRIEVYADGTFQVEDPSTVVHVQLSPAEQDQLFEAFAVAGFDGLPDAAPNRARLTLACERSQSVDPRAHAAALEPVLTRLSGLRERALADAITVVSRTANVLPVTVVDWPRGAIPLAELYAKQLATSATAELPTELRRRLPAKLLATLRAEGDGHAQRSLYARDGDEAYPIWLRGCLGERPGCDGESYAALGVGTISAVVWPRAAPDLAGVGEGGEVVPSSQVDRVDRLRTRSIRHALSGNQLYTGVTLRRRSPGR